MYFTSLLLLVSEREEDNLSGLLTSQHLVMLCTIYLKYLSISTLTSLIVLLWSNVS